MSEKHSLRSFLIIILGYLAASLFGGAYTFHLIHSLHWPDVSILQGTWSSLLSFAVLLSGGIFVDRLGPSRLQYLVLVSMVGLLLLFNSLSPFWGSKAISFTGLLVVGLADPLLSVAAMPLHRGLAVHYLHGAGQRYLNGWLLEITTAPIIGLGCGLLLTGLVLALRYFKPDEQLQAGAVGPV